MSTVDLRIHDVAFGGKGVGRVNGKATFVPFTIDEESITAQIVREKKQFAEGTLVKVVQESPHRVAPPCPYFGRCGGCSYQHIEYEHQLSLKSRQVEGILQRIGRIKNPPLRRMIPSPLQYGYRNRITVHSEEGVTGFYRADSRRIIDVERCPIAADEVNAALAHLRATRPRDGHYTLRAKTGPRIFVQANDGVAGEMKSLVSQLIPPEQDLLIDAYCGGGFFAKSLGPMFTSVVGIDWDRFAIEAAQRDATANERYIAGDVDAELRALLANSNSPRTTVIVDPPAAGLTEGSRTALLEFSPGTLVYVSCNPPTLARDLAQLEDRFAIEAITPMDMFPQTAEIEVVTHLRSK